MKSLRMSDANEMTERLRDSVTVYDQAHAFVAILQNAFHQCAECYSNVLEICSEPLSSKRLAQDLTGVVRPSMWLSRSALHFLFIPANCT